MTPLIRLEKVSKEYMLGETLVTALKEVSLTIPGGGIVALMGPSGSGKSTLLNLLGVLDNPSSGKVFFKGQDVTILPPDEKAGFRNSTIGFIFQNFNLVPVLTTMENVLLPAQLSRISQGGTTLPRARQLLERVGLAKQMDQSVNRLSGGQMQRVAIARALINKPEVVLADEPTANLDHETAENVLKLLKEMCLSEGTTVLIATHDHSVLPYCQRIITLRDGRLLKDELQDAEIF